MENTLIGYSKALYSTWFYYKPARLMWDAGEGIIQTLGKRIYGIRKIFLSHGHEDHIAGLPSLINLRNLSMGDRDVPLEIYHPRDDAFIEFLREYLEKKQGGRIRYPLTWHALEPGAETEIETSRRSTRVVAFAVDHAKAPAARAAGACLGYRLEEQRYRLRPEFRDLDTQQVRALVLERGREAVVERIRHPLLIYTGDSRPFQDPELFREADLLLIDATFRDAADCADSRHGHIEASVEIAVEAGVHHLVLIHLSERYGKREIREAIKKAKDQFGSPPHLGYFFEGRYFEVG